MRCERCDEDAKKGERYCKECRKAVISEMKEAGYLQSVPPKWTSFRNQEQAENTYETKHGTGHG